MSKKQKGEPWHKRGTSKAPGPRKSVQDYLKKQIEIEQSHLALSREVTLGLLGQFFSEIESTDWNDREKRGRAADFALRLNDDELLANAFKDFGLNPENPYHWRRLAGHLAAVLYTNRRGANLKWMPHRLLQLVSDVREITGEPLPKSAKRIWPKLQKKHPSEYTMTYDHKLWKKALDCQSAAEKQVSEMKSFSHPWAPRN